MKLGRLSIKAISDGRLCLAKIVKVAPWLWSLRTSIVGAFSGHCETVLCPVQVRCVAMWVCAQLETGPCPRPRHCCVGGHINNVLGISPHSHLISPRQLWLKIFEWNGKIIVIVCSQLAVSRVLAPGGSCLSGCSVDTSPHPPHPHPEVFLHQVAARCACMLAKYLVLSWRPKTTFKMIVYVVCT